MFMKKLLQILFKYRTDNTETNPSLNILPCLKEVSDYLKSKGVFSSIQKYEVVSSFGVRTKHANLLAYNPKNRNAHILFQGHVDTIPFDSSYQYKITKKNLVGRGAVDMKGSIAGMMTAFLNLYENSSKLKYPLALLITADEEANGFAGIRYFLKATPISIKVAINGEPTNLSVSKKFKGISIYKIEKHGRAGHSSSDKNDRLIEKSIFALVRIKKFLDESRKIRNKKFGKTVAALTVCNAGIKSNQLPETIKIEFNLRIVDDYTRYEKMFKRLVKKYLDKDFIVRSTHFNPTESKIDGETLNGIISAFKKTNLTYKESTFNAFSEAVIMTRRGVPVIACGPGNISLAHVKPADEEIPIKSIEIYSELLKNIVQEINS